MRLRSFPQSSELRPAQQPRLSRATRLLDRELDVILFHNVLVLLARVRVVLRHL